MAQTTHPELAPNLHEISERRLIHENYIEGQISKNNKLIDKKYDDIYILNANSGELTVSSNNTVIKHLTVQDSLTVPITPTFSNGAYITVSPFKTHSFLVKL